MRDEDIPDRIRGELDSQRLRVDPEENLKSTPPENENVLIRCCWVVECYPSSFGLNLRLGLDALGWVKPFPGGDERYYIDWIEQVRRSSFRGGCLSLGILKSNKNPTKGYLAPSCAELPDGVQYVSGWVVHLLPGMTQLVLQFVFDEPTAITLNGPLRDKYRSYITKLDKGYRFINPTHQKHEAVECLRRSLKKRCWEWVTERLPGVFASGLLDGMFPTAEFITLNESDPFNESSSEERRSYLKVLDLSYSPYVWASKDLKGLFISLPSRNESDFSQAVLSGRTSDLKKQKDLEAYGPDPEQAILARLEYLDYSLAVFALKVLLLSYDRRLGMLRDEVAAIEIGNPERSSRDLRKIQNLFVHLDGDVELFYVELQRFCRSKNAFHHELFEFGHVTHRKEDEPDLYEQMRLFMLMAAPQVGHLARRIAGHIAGSASLIAAESNERATRANLKLQRWLLWVTIALLIFTAVLVCLEISREKTVAGAIRVAPKTSLDSVQSGASNGEIRVLNLVCGWPRD
jgi:hypothetical protein